MNIAKKSSRSDNETESLINSPSLPISDFSLVRDVRNYIEELRISSPQDSPVSPLVSPESEKALMTNATCGQPQPTLFGLSNHDTFCLKMCPEYAPICPWSSETCADVGMTFNDPSSLGLTTLGRRTDENGSGLWQTPSVEDAGRQGKAENWREYLEEGRTTQCRLRNQVMWPTPREGNPGSRPNGKGGKILAEEVKKWPTPRANDAEKRGAIANDLRNGLPAAVRHWPTPASCNGTGGATGLAGGSGNRSKLYAMPGKEERKKMGCQSLNPYWVEVLMGWPKNWTCLNTLSHVDYIQWLMGGTNDKETRARETMRILRIGHVAEEVSRETGRPVSIPPSAVLLAELCEHANRPDQARIFMACAETLEKEMRSVRIQQGITGAPSGSEHQEQRQGKHPDALQALSRLLAYYGKEAWKDGSWENGIPRVANKVANRVDRLKAIGNGQVPLCVATAFRLLSGGRF